MKAKQIIEQDLSVAEIAFIKQHGISIKEIIDVGSMIPIGQKRAMEAKGARLCITNRSCSKGHRFKTRSNHCPVCEPKNLAFEKRHSEKAFVYVCRSGTGLVKIGYAADPQERKSRLNREAFASCSNWQLVFKIETEKAGKVEAVAQGKLMKKSSAETYMKGEYQVTTREVFRCSEDEAIAAVRLAITELRL
ncbi:putative GIY-YIG superfamily endonuclease [Bradyrhizobium sp. LB8.2]|uniref:GIY-YIG nuclease family protein n=1 Tax=unclassified Bradyrhizobium TaxID=2631580 RepID=UPI0033911E34